jgi:phage major head subunit gpT-like protein
MADITPAVSINALGLYTKYSQIFQQAFMEYEVFWSKFAQPFESTTSSELHVWLDRVPKLRLWNGDRMLQSALLRSYQLTNLTFELTEELDAFNVADNKIDAFGPVVQMMALQSKKWADDLFFDPQIGAIVLGATTNTYDGQPFFSTAHPVNQNNPSSATQSNFATSTKFTATNYFNARYSMMSYLGYDLHPLYVTPDMLMIPPLWEAAALQVLNTTYIAPSIALGQNAAAVMQENPLIGTADLLVVPDLEQISSINGNSGNPWLLMDVSKPIKPFIFQLREPPEFVMNVAPNSPAMISRHALQYSVFTRGVGGYGPYWLAYLGIG